MNESQMLPEADDKFKHLKAKQESIKNYLPYQYFLSDLCITIFLYTHALVGVLFSQSKTVI